LIGDISNQLAIEACKNAALNGGSTVGVSANLVTQDADSMLAEAA